MLIEVTKAQLEAIKALADEASSANSGDEDNTKEVTKNVMLVDRMLKKNNLPPRDYC